MLKIILVLLIGLSNLPKTTPCVGEYVQCGGIGYTGATECCASWTCVYSDSSYAQCRPNSSPSTTGCSALYGQCGGETWTGATCCDYSTCTYSNPWYSQCLLDSSFSSSSNSTISADPLVHASTTTPVHTSTTTPVHTSTTTPVHASTTTPVHASTTTPVHTSTTTPVHTSTTTAVHTSTTTPVHTSTTTPVHTSTTTPVHTSTTTPAHTSTTTPVHTSTTTPVHTSTTTPVHTSTTIPAHTSTTTPVHTSTTTPVHTSTTTPVHTSTTTPVHTSTTTLSPTQSTSSSSTSSANQTPGAVYGQCGGIGWNGPSTCVSGSTCVYSNPWYSQCLPSGGPSGSSSSPSSGGSNTGSSTTTLPINGNSQAGTTTRYWDCCKVSCGWAGKAQVTTPVETCEADGVTTVGDGTASGCDGGTAYTCSNQQPWNVSSTLSYGYAAAAFSGESESDWCCACYSLIFTSGPVAGKQMIVQVTNTGSDVGGTQFDLQMPGGGVGIFNGCANQFPLTPLSAWGAQYGGVSDRQSCSGLPTVLQPGCYWRFDWFMGADNPSVTFTQVTCPSALTSNTQCIRN